MIIQFNEAEDGVLEAECPNCTSEVTACIGEDEACCIYCGFSFTRDSATGIWEVYQ